MAATKTSTEDLRAAERMTTEQVYAAIKSGELSTELFEHWVSYNYSEAYADGRDAGWDEANYN